MKKCLQNVKTCCTFYAHICTNCPCSGVEEEVGDAEGTMPSGKHFPPRGGLSASLSPAWSFIIYRRDKIKQTQQNGVKSGSCGSHRYTLSRVERLAEMHTEFCLIPCSCLPASLSQQQSGGNLLLEYQQCHTLRTCATGCM